MRHWMRMSESEIAEHARPVGRVRSHARQARHGDTAAHVGRPAVNDFGTTLTTLFDEVADTIEPRPNFESVLHGEIAASPSATSHLHRPPWQTLGLRARPSVALRRPGRWSRSTTVLPSRRLGGDTRPGPVGCACSTRACTGSTLPHAGRGSRPSTNEPERPVVVAPAPTEPSTTTTVAAGDVSACGRNRATGGADARPPRSPLPAPPSSAGRVPHGDPMKQALYGTATPEREGDDHLPVRRGRHARRPARRMVGGARS